MIEILSIRLEDAQHDLSIKAHKVTKTQNYKLFSYKLPCKKINISPNSKKAKRWLKHTRRARKDTNKTKQTKILQYPNGKSILTYSILKVFTAMSKRPNFGPQSVQKIYSLIRQSSKSAGQVRQSPIATFWETPISTHYPSIYTIPIYIRHYQRRFDHKQ